MGWFASLLAWLSSLLFAKKADIAIVGLQGSGKSSFVNVLVLGATAQVVPTVAFQVREVRKEGVRLKIWDVAGQPKYRSLWERYCSGSNAIVYVVDSHDTASFAEASSELDNLLSLKSLVGVPLLVLGNKNDLEGHASVEEIISTFKLDSISNRSVSCYSVR